MRNWRIFALILIDLAMIAMEGMVMRQEFRGGAKVLRFYTQSSNLWALIVCGICLAGDIFSLVSGKPRPEWMRVLRYVSACCLMVTMIVAMAILVPSGASGGFRGFMLEGTLLYLHTLCPLVMLLGWCLDAGAPLRAGHALIAILPTVVYGAITIVMNVKRVYRGPYFFFEVYRQSVPETLMWAAVILGGNFLVAWLLGKIHHILG